MNKEEKENLRNDLILEIIDLIRTKQTKKSSQHNSAIKDAIRNALDKLEN